MDWNRCVAHIVTEAKIHVAVAFVGDLRGFCEKVGPELLNFMVKLHRQLRVARTCKTRVSIFGQLCDPTHIKFVGVKNSNPFGYCHVLT